MQLVPDNGTNSCSLDDYVPLVYSRDILVFQKLNKQLQIDGVDGACAPVSRKLSISAQIGKISSLHKPFGSDMWAKTHCWCTL